MLWWCQILCVFELIVYSFSSPISSRKPGDDGEIGKSSSTEEEDEGSDNGLYNKVWEEGDIYNKRFRGKTTIAITSDNEEPLWPDGVIIYKLDEKIGCPDSAQCEVLMKAMNHYHVHSCIRFQEWTGERDYVKIFFNPHSGECWSAVGRMGGEQPLSLGRRCWYQGIVIHELGHSVGFEHEMNRPDRDNYISINWNNILPGFATAFEKQNSSSFESLDEEFDFKSIMMYDEFAFSKDKNSPTISANDKSIIGPIWRKPGLSDGDVRRIGKMYSCNKSVKPTNIPKEVTCSFNQHTCGFKNSGKESWRWNQINNNEGYIYLSTNSSTQKKSEELNNVVLKDEVGYFVSVNFNGINAGKEGSEMGCVSFCYMIRGDSNVYLKLRQSYLSRTTQLNHLEEDTFDLWESEGTAEEWTNLQIPLYVTQPFKLIFESSSGHSSEGLIALDDFHLSFSPCETSP